MVKLENIEKNNNLIECDILPEDSKEYGHLKVNLDSEEIDGYALPEGYEWCRNHLTHAKKALLKYGTSKEPLPDQDLIMWY